MPAVLDPSRIRHRPRALTLALVTIAVLLAAACGGGGDQPSGSDDETGTGPATSAPAPPAPPTAGVLRCEPRTPGEPLDEVDAVVRFTDEEICPGYVTVVVETEVTWANDDEQDHQLVLTPLAASGDEGAALLEVAVPAGGSVSQRFDEPGLYAYRVDAMPSFRGTVEVQDGSAAER